MTEDQRRNKLSEKDCFYLELHQHGGNFEAMLTPDELTNWNMFPDFHQRFFTYFQNQEWEIVSSLRRFSDDIVIGRVNGAPVTKADQADISMQFYHRHRKQARTTLMLDELQALLYPLREFNGDLLRQEIADALYLQATDPDIAGLRGSQEWQQHGVLSEAIPLVWLDKQSSDYLTECASVWKSYLPQEPLPQQEKKTHQSTEDKREELREIYQEMKKDLGRYAAKGLLLSRTAEKAGCSVDSVKRALGDKK